VKPEKKPEKKVERVVSPKKYYEEDATLETIETKDQPKPVPAPPAPPPLGLAPKTMPPPVLRQEPEPAVFTDDDGNPAPITTLEYDDFDAGADVSVMESLGGPSLLIEKQRQAMMIKSSENVVPSDIVNTFAQDYPAELGLSREQTIQKDPLRFYTHVVKLLLEAHEPEKVRLLDKLLAKYKGREDHLVQKLSVRYNRSDEGGTPTIPEEDEDKVSNTFAGAVISNKASPAAAAAVATAKERAATFDAWGDHGRQDVADEEVDDGDSVSASGSEFSRDSIDGTSPAVIAQVSELLNYVYGKTSVPGQIDRVSTIMRAYEGREAVLLELLETKALIKANSEKENAGNLPSFLRNSPSLQHGINGEENPADEAIEQSVSPLSSPHIQNQQQAVGGNIINDDISSMSGVSSPAPEKKIETVSSRGSSVAMWQWNVTTTNICPSRYATHSHRIVDHHHRRNLLFLKTLRPTPMSRLVWKSRNRQNKWSPLRMKRRQNHPYKLIGMRKRRRKDSSVACLVERRTKRQAGGEESKRSLQMVPFKEKVLGVICYVPMKKYLFFIFECNIDM
jgi:hypothetical protein